jgi:hypothetical protein
MKVGHREMMELEGSLEVAVAVAVDAAAMGQKQGAQAEELHRADCEADAAILRAAEAVEEALNIVTFVPVHRFGGDGMDEGKTHGAHMEAVHSRNPLVAVQYVHTEMYRCIR